MKRSVQAVLVAVLIATFMLVPGVAMADELAAGAPEQTEQQEGADSDEETLVEADVDLSSATVRLGKRTWAYTGKAIRPSARVSLDGGKLVEGRDYRISYKRNTKVGTATVTANAVRGSGFVGRASATFTIIPMAAKIAQVQSPSAKTAIANVAKVPGAKGYEFRIGTNKKVTKAVATKSATSPSVRFRGLREGGKYYVKVRAFARIDGKVRTGAWSRPKAVTVKYKPMWMRSGDYFTYRRDNGKLAHGLFTVKGQTYLFDKLGHQKTGWQHYKGEYRFFAPANKAGGSMRTNCVVNGIKLRRDGTAVVAGAAGEELSIMCKAQKLVESLTVPTMSKDAKLSRGFYWVKNECVESLTRNFSNYNGWHRAMALDVFDRHTGSCFSYGAALAYYANAVGYGQCAAISSGGHGWAEIDGRVYDAEWSRHCGRDLYAIDYAASGGGTPAYGSNRAYVVDIAPRTARW